jgi:multidrug efflux pump subunit AcrB
VKLIEFPIRRHQFTLVAFLCVAALGVAAFLGMPREEDPYIKAPGFLVTGVYPGADPVDLEREFAKPVEDRIAELDDVSRIETNVADGVAVIAVEFEAHTDADRKLDEVTREVNSLRPLLPPSIRQIDITRWGPTQVNIVQLALVSPDAPYSELEDAARDLEDVLKAVDGVRSTDSWAYPDRELRVQLDPARMERLGVTPQLIGQAIQAANSSLPAGVIDLASRSFSVQTGGGYDDIEQLRATVVRTAGGQTVRVADVADVAWAEGQHTHLGRYNGERAVFVTATQSPATTSSRCRSVSMRRSMPSNPRCPRA